MLKNKAIFVDCEIKHLYWKRASLAAGSGAAGVIGIWAGLYAALVIAFYNWSLIPGGSDPRRRRAVFQRLKKAAP